MTEYDPKTCGIVNMSITIGDRERLTAEEVMQERERWLQQVAEGKTVRVEDIDRGKM